MVNAIGVFIILLLLYNVITKFIFSIYTSKIIFHENRKFGNEREIGRGFTILMQIQICLIHFTVFCTKHEVNII